MPNKTNRTLPQLLQHQPGGFLLALLVFGLLLSGCNTPEIQASVASTATRVPAPIVRYTTNTPTPTITLTPTDTPPATPTPETPSPTPSPTETRTPYPTKDPDATFTPMPVFPALGATPEATFWFSRPIGSGFQDYPDPNYRYATTQNGAYRPHYGADYPNPLGTPVLAAGPGEVIHAAPDWETTLGPNPYFYGNVIVILHDVTYNDQPVFTLYAHLDQIGVAPGQRVDTGQIIGSVGGTGVALGGAHLHFEVRIGYNDYDSTRNPELWLRPYSRWGTLAGRVTDENGQLVPIANVTIRSTILDDPEENEPVNRYTVTYQNGVTTNPDDRLGENFVVSDLPPGLYTITVNNGSRTVSGEVRIEPDRLSWIAFDQVSPPPTWTPTPSATPTP